MRTTRNRLRFASLVAATALFLQAAVSAQSVNADSPLEITFTKWVTASPLMSGFTGGDAPGVFVGEVLQRQVSVNPGLNGIVRLEAVYEVQAGDRSFTALIRGGTDNVTGAAILDGVILAGWRTGAPVHVTFQTVPGAVGCVGAPIGVTCFEGTIHVGRVPTAKN
jgi:hypothetical protein